MQVNNQPMSKRLIRPTNLPDKDNFHSASNHEIPTLTVKNVNASKRKALNVSALSESKVGNKIKLNSINQLSNQRTKVLNAKDQNLHVNRDTSNDNPLRRVAQGKKAHVFKSFTHTRAL